MTDISTTAPTTRRPDLPRLRFPRLAVGASLDGISRLIGNALIMAYVDPYTGSGRRQQIVPDDDLEGRDPDW
jgi:hypothetical protein